MNAWWCRRWGCCDGRVRRAAIRGTRVILSMLLLVVVLDSGVAEAGMARWFSCGITFWSTCVPSPDVEVPTSPNSTLVARETEAITPEALRNWGTPVVGPHGALSYQLPPRPLLELFHEPTDANARAYLTWLSEKTRHRDAAFAAIKRMAAEVGYSVGQRPSENIGSAVTSEILTGALPADMAAGLTAKAAPQPGSAVPSPHGMVNPAALTQRVHASSPSSAGEPGVPPTLGPQTRIFYFFAPHCPYCTQQTPLMNELLRGRKDVVGIAMDTTPEALMTYLRTVRFPFPVTLDRGESRGFGITGYPTVVVRDNTGAARKLTGLATKEQLQQVLQGFPS